MSAELMRVDNAGVPSVVQSVLPVRENLVVRAFDGQVFHLSDEDMEHVLYCKDGEWSESDWTMFMLSLEFLLRRKMNIGPGWEPIGSAMTRWGFEE